MKRNVILVLILVFVGYHNVSAQGVLKKLKDKVTSVTTGESNSGNTNNESNNSAVSKLTPAQIKQMVEKKQLTYGTYSDQGATSAAHSKYMGKVVFSNSQVKFKNEDESKFKNTFNIEETLFLQFYMQRSIRNQTSQYLDLGLGNTPYYKGLIYVNDKLAADWEVAGWHRPGNSFDEWTTNGFPFATSDIDLQGEQANTWVNLASGLAAGKYKIRVEMAIISFAGNKNNEFIKFSYDTTAYSANVTYIKDVVSSGEFTLNVTDKGKAILLQKYAIKPPVAAQSNPVLEKEIKALVLKGYNETALKVVILDPKWEFYHNDLGILIYRYVYALVISKNAEGKCMGSVFVFAQDKGDGNKYGTTYIESVASANDWVKEYTCAAIK